MAEVNGIEKFGEVVKCQRRLYMIGDEREEREYPISPVTLKLM